LGYSVSHSAGNKMGGPSQAAELPSVVQTLQMELDPEPICGHMACDEGEGQTSRMIRPLDLLSREGNQPPYGDEPES
jgi:hypothetical protein